jgi:hypothetical protein
MAAFGMRNQRFEEDQTRKGPTQIAGNDAHLDWGLR